MTPARLATFVLVTALAATMAFGVVATMPGATPRRPAPRSRLLTASDTLRRLDWRSVDWQTIDWSRVALDVLHLPQTIRTSLSETLDGTLSGTLAWLTGETTHDAATTVGLSETCRDRV